MKEYDKPKIPKKSKTEKRKEAGTFVEFTDKTFEQLTKKEIEMAMKETFIRLGIIRE